MTPQTSVQLNSAAQPPQHSQYTRPWPQDEELTIASPGQNVALPLPELSVSHTDPDQLSITVSWQGRDGPVSVRLRRLRSAHGWNLPLDYGAGTRVDAQLTLDHSGVAVTLPGIFARHIWGLGPRVPTSAQGQPRHRDAGALPVEGVWACGVGRDVHRRVHVAPSLTPGVVLIGGVPVTLSSSSTGLGCLFELRGPDAPDQTRRNAHVTSLDGGASWKLHDPDADAGASVHDVVSGLTHDAYLQAISRAAEHAPGRWPQCTLSVDRSDPDNSNLILGGHGEPERVYALLPGEERRPFTVRTALADQDGTPAGEAVMRVVIRKDGLTYLPNWTDLVTPEGALLSVTAILDVLIETTTVPERSMVTRMARSRQSATSDGEYTGDALALGLTLSRLLTRFTPAQLAGLDHMTFGEAGLQCGAGPDGQVNFTVLMGGRPVMQLERGTLKWDEQVTALASSGPDSIARALRLSCSAQARTVFTLLTGLGVLHVGPAQALCWPAEQ